MSATSLPKASNSLACTGSIGDMFTDTISDSAGTQKYKDLFSAWNSATGASACKAPTAPSHAIWITAVLRGETSNLYTLAPFALMVYSNLPTGTSNIPRSVPILSSICTTAATGSVLFLRSFLDLKWTLYSPAPGTDTTYTNGLRTVGVNIPFAGGFPDMGLRLGYSTVVDLNLAISSGRGLCFAANTPRSNLSR